ncbi:MAG: DUF1902 domain-containing protein [Burkholderiaceae bacterium]|jgi:hypothetical protein|nr:DUF1902 domain-containing protein [Burkholderiaceae bacterium]
MELEVKVTYYDDDKIWVAECDALHLATDERSYESLIKRVWLIAPELFVENKLSGSVEDLRLSFVQRNTTCPQVAYA